MLLVNQMAPPLILLLLLLLLGGSVCADFNADFVVTWGGDHVRVLDNGQQLQLKMDKSSGSGFTSKSKYLFGKLDMQIKLVPGNSAGTVTAYYLFSEFPTATHDELDFEFLGNVTGQPYILQTNVFASGKADREQRMFLWFDPTSDFHTYSILWNPHLIIFYVDGIAIRAFPNMEASGTPYPNKQPMGVYSSLWNGESWATRGGLVKIDWNEAPFIASYRNFSADACVWRGSLADASNCASGKWWNSRAMHTLDAKTMNQLKWVHHNFTIYDYCSDKTRFPVPPRECTLIAL